jgi:hypothetical protein
MPSITARIEEVKKKIDQMEKGCSHFITESRYYCLKTELATLEQCEKWEAEREKEIIEIIKEVKSEGCNCSEEEGVCGSCNSLGYLIQNLQALKQNE